jgi:hypothetical protein
MRLGKGLDPRVYDIHLDKRKRVWDSKTKAYSRLSTMSKRLKD